MKINCLHCGHKFDLGDAYDDYDGMVRCATCGGLLDIKTQDGSVRSMRFAAAPTAQPSPMRLVSETSNAPTGASGTGVDAAQAA